MLPLHRKGVDPPLAPPRLSTTPTPTQHTFRPASSLRLCPAFWGWWGSPRAGGAAQPPAAGQAVPPPLGHLCRTPPTSGRQGQGHCASLPPPRLPPGRAPPPPSSPAAAPAPPPPPSLPHIPRFHTHSPRSTALKAQRWGEPPSVPPWDRQALRCWACSAMPSCCQSGWR